ncbi:hypothetical protein [Sphaerospermopsis sp. LEGE 00249]|jgi:putative transposase|nr:hypothetical protein [Sphaerospermopsis sp. LEGE 00249]
MSQIKAKLKFHLIQWFAESPNLTIKSQINKAVADTLGVYTRHLEA